MLHTYVCYAKLYKIFKMDNLLAIPNRLFYLNLLEYISQIKFCHIINYMFKCTSESHGIRCSNRVD